MQRRNNCINTFGRNPVNCEASVHCALFYGKLYVLNDVKYFH